MVRSYRISVNAWRELILIYGDLFDFPKISRHPPYWRSREVHEEFRVAAVFAILFYNFVPLKPGHTIYILACLWFIFFFANPIAQSFYRPLSPRIGVAQNMEFHPSWDWWVHKDLYLVALRYAYNIKPNDTILTYSYHLPDDEDIYIASWFNESVSFYSCDSIGRQTEHILVENIDVLKWWTIIDGDEPRKHWLPKPIA